MCLDSDNLRYVNIAGKLNISFNLHVWRTIFPSAVDETDLAHGFVSVLFVLAVVGGVMIAILAKMYYSLKLDHCSLSINSLEFPPRLMG